MRLSVRLAAVPLIALGCSVNDQSSSSAADSARGGTIVIAVGGDPDGLFPPVLTTTTGKAVTEQIYDHLADLGADLNTVGDAGFSPTTREELELVIRFPVDCIHAKPGSTMARWHTRARIRRRLHARTL